jgi:hypothetical protein
MFDPLYKLADGVENAAEDMKVILNGFDRLAEISGAAIVYVHHDSKGTPGDKDIRDRGAGSNVLGRDYDACMTLTAHSQNDNAVVVDVLLRNYRPHEPFSILWTCDESGGSYCFNMAEGIAPDKKTSRNKPAPPPVTVYLPFAEKILGNQEMDFSLFKSDFKDATGLSDHRIREFLNWATAGGSPHLETREDRKRGAHNKWVQIPKSRC